MRGYKLLSNEMKATNGNNMQYELNKVFSISNTPVPFVRGYHFCKNIEDTVIWYNSFNENRLFEVDTLDGDVINTGDRKLVSNKIQLVREIPLAEIKEYIQSNLNKLLNDENWHIRKAVAEQGYGLDKLINDKDHDVRIAVAEQGYGLDKLIDDKHWCVRRAVAEQGFGLDKLINDKNPDVRRAVAKQGYSLDKLINDEDYDVRETARYYLSNNSKN